MFQGLTFDQARILRSEAKRTNPNELTEIGRVKVADGIQAMTFYC
jgi:hypothetical protein